MAKNKIDSEAKELAIGILASKGVEYEDWLNNQHSKVITENSKLLIECLNNNRKGEQKSGRN